MKMTRKAALLTMLAGSVAWAQDPGMGRPGGMGFHEMGGAPWRTVTGAPYSADVSSTVVRTLADGNSIQHVTTGHVARDAQGRTYSQETVTGSAFGQSGPKTFIFISDPVAGFTYSLDPETKVATKRAIHKRGPEGPGAPPSGVAAEGKRGEHTADPNAVSADLGTQAINGINAQGKKTTRTIPAGRIGNAQPIVSTSERWFSPDLQVMVSAKSNDPQSGQHVFALTNIQRGEPAAMLFQVPSDYTIKEATGHGPHGPGGPR